MAHHYGLDLWRWNEEEGAHEPPPGARAVLDFRPWEKQAEARQNVDGYGFFDWPDTIDGVPNEHSRPDSAIPLGDGDCREYKPTTAERNELKTRLGITGDLSGETLVANIRSVLGENADPTGQSGPKPLMPDRFGNEEIHLSNHSKVWAAKFDWREVFAVAPRGAANRIRDVIRMDLERTHADGGNELLSKVMGSWCDRAAVRYDDGQAWRGLMRAALRSKAGGSFKPKRPQTSYSDDFNRADGSIGGSWATSTAIGVSWLISSNVAQCFYDYPTALTASANYARYESDLSSADHWCDFTATSRTGGSAASHQSACLCRYSASANTAYGSRKSYSTSSVSNELVKIVAGTISSLGSVSYTGIGQRRVQAAGSTISCEGPVGTSRVSLTDTSITGNTRCGLLGQYTATIGADLSQQMDAFSCDDGLLGVVGPVLFYMHYVSQGWR